MKKLSPGQAKFIDSQKVARYATAHQDRPHVVPICPVWDPENRAIYFVTDYKTRKLGNTEKNPHVAIVFDTFTRGSRGVMVQGRATVLHRGEEYRRIRGMLYKKFPQYKRPDLTFKEGEAPIIRIDPDHAAEW
ncbi:MAG: pyridoxamine 5'-phosphate oxidase family protein [Euryarchaeota archaeon]|nr:pyridoxamine 5'-phosphate oxidase family protein [Euryarchaeota archaeon]